MKSRNNRLVSPTKPLHNASPAGGLGASTGESDSLVAVVAHGVPVTSPPLRARLLQLLIMPIGPLAMTVLAGGTFARYAEFARRLPIPISAEDAARVTSGQVAEIARYLEQADPSMLEQVVVTLSHDPTAMAALGTSFAAIAVKIASASLSRGTKTVPRAVVGSTA